MGTLVSAEPWEESTMFLADQSVADFEKITLYGKEDEFLGVEECAAPRGIARSPSPSREAAPSRTSTTATGLPSHRLRYFLFRADGFVGRAWARDARGWLVSERLEEAIKADPTWPGYDLLGLAKVAGVFEPLTRIGAIDAVEPPEGVDLRMELEVFGPRIGIPPDVTSSPLSSFRCPEWRVPLITVHTWPAHLTETQPEAPWFDLPSNAPSSQPAAVLPTVPPPGLEEAPLDLLNVDKSRLPTVASLRGCPPAASTPPVLSGVFSSRAALLAIHRPTVDDLMPLRVALLEGLSQCDLASGPPGPRWQPVPNLSLWQQPRSLAVVMAPLACPWTIPSVAIVPPTMHGWPQPWVERFEALSASPEMPNARSTPTTATAIATPLNFVPDKESSNLAPTSGLGTTPARPSSSALSLKRRRTPSPRSLPPPTPCASLIEPSQPPVVVVRASSSLAELAGWLLADVQSRRFPGQRQLVVTRCAAEVELLAGLASDMVVWGDYRDYLESNRGTRVVAEALERLGSLDLAALALQGTRCLVVTETEVARGDLGKLRPERYQFEVFDLAGEGRSLPGVMQLITKIFLYNISPYQDRLQRRRPLVVLRTSFITEETSQLLVDLEGEHDFELVEREAHPHCPFDLITGPRSCALIFVRGPPDMQELLCKLTALVDASFQTIQVILVHDHRPGSQSDPLLVRGAILDLVAMALALSPVVITLHHISRDAAALAKVLHPLPLMTPPEHGFEVETVHENFLSLVPGLNPWSAALITRTVGLGPFLTMSEEERRERVKDIIPHSRISAMLNE